MMFGDCKHELGERKHGLGGRKEALNVVCIINVLRR